MAVLAASTPQPMTTHQFEKNLIHDVIKSSLKELLISGIFAGVALFFVMSPGDFAPCEGLEFFGMPFILGSTFIMFAINTTLRGISARAKYKIHLLEKQQPNEVSNKQKVKLQKCNEVCSDISTFLFSTLNFRLIFGIIGSLTAMLLFKDANPIIGFFGDAHYNVSSGMTSIGNFFNNAGIDPMTVVAGVGFSSSLMMSFLAPTLADRVKKAHPNFYNYIDCISIISLIRIFLPIIYGFVSQIITVPYVDDAFCRLFKDASFLEAAGLPLWGQFSIVALCGLATLIHYKRRKAQEEMALKIKSPPK